MDAISPVVPIIAFSLGTAWASGINLYAAILVLGLLGITNNIVLPPGLHVLMHPAVISAAGVMYFLEFFADKVPGLDTTWDAFHSFIRIPAGAVIAAGAIGDVNPALTLTAAIIGGSLAAGSHAFKSGTRILINASPEPFTNIGASLAEDVLVVAGLWTAIYHPLIFLVMLLIFLIALAIALPKIWQGIRSLARWLCKSLCFWKSDREPWNSPLKRVSDIKSGMGNTVEAKYEALRNLKGSALITKEEYERQQLELERETGKRKKMAKRGKKATDS